MKERRRGRIRWSCRVSVFLSAYCRCSAVVPSSPCWWGVILVAIKSFLFFRLLSFPFAPWGKVTIVRLLYVRVNVLCWDPFVIFFWPAFLLN